MAPTPLTVYHTNDFHNKLNESKAARLKALKDKTPNSLLLDAGDAIWAGNVIVRPGGEHALRLMNAAGYDAMAMGNREFHFLQSGFRAKVGRAEFPVLCANARSTKPGVIVPVVPSIIKEIDGVRVGILGLTVPMITEKMLVRAVSPYVFDDPVHTASEIVPTLRAETDLVIGLTHIGLKEDRRLAAEVPGIDLIVGGHTHVVLKSPEMIGNAAISQAGSHGRFVGCVEIHLDGNAPRVVGSIMEL